jgi:hypothetical protein
VPDRPRHPAQAAVLRSAREEVPDCHPDRRRHHSGHQIREEVPDQPVHRLRHCHSDHRGECPGQGVHCRRGEAVLHRLAEQVGQGVQVHAVSRNRAVPKTFCPDSFSYYGFLAVTFIFQSSFPYILSSVG